MEPTLLEREVLSASRRSTRQWQTIRPLATGAPPGGCLTKDGSTAAAINRPISPIFLVIPQYCGTPQKIEKMYSIPHSPRYNPLSQTGS